jgi:hypothetical protein
MADGDYDPDDLPPRRARRRRQSFDEYDDAWAAADEEGDFDGDADIGDYAAGYVDEPRDDRARPYQYPYDIHDQRTAPAPDRRYDTLRSDRLRRDRIYADSPTYHRDRARRGEYGEFYGAPPKPKRDPMRLYAPDAGGRMNIPFWQILFLVILAMAALMATAVACAAILAL